MADDILAGAREAFERVEESENDNRRDMLDDLRFARLGEQWPADIEKQRQRENKPCLTLNKMPAFIRQVVNDARQNKPSIKVHPVDSGADKETADIYNGLIRNIEYTSSADVAYDTATECAVAGGWGYFRIGMDYAHEDTFDLDLSIDRVSNPFSVYGDPASTAADSSDWTTAFVVDIMAKDVFEKKYKGATPTDWQSDSYRDLLGTQWFTEDHVMLAEWWVREEYEKDILLLSDGTVQTVEAMKLLADMMSLQGVTVVKQRKAKCWRVKQHRLTGAELLETTDWPGQYIPIVPVYGDEVDVEGRRYFRSLIRDAKDAQRNYNYWRTTTTELVALAPKTPFIGPKGAFKTDFAKWATANTASHQYIEYDPVAGQPPPQRQPFASVPAGPMHEALSASDDMKAIMGLYDASLGQRSNETSGRAIMARQREGDVSTFHFQDNMARAIRHAGRILLDLIPHVYDKARIVRVIGEDGTQEAKPVNQPTPVTDKNGQPVMQQTPDGRVIPMTRVYDLTAGKYDLTVSSGPSYTTKREEAASQMTEMIRAFPAMGPVIGDIVAKNLDWPGADEIAERLKAVNPALNKAEGGGIPPELQKAIQQGQQQIQALTQEVQQLKMDKTVDMEKIAVDRQKVQVEGMKAQTEQYRAETERAMPQPSFETVGTA